MKKTPHIIIQTILLAVMGVLMAALLICLWVTPNVETQQSRETAGYEILQDVS